jgi:hypothetical protein
MLGTAVNSAWTSDYQGSGVSGFVLTDKTDSLKVLFFPLVGECYNGLVMNAGRYGSYWSSSLVNNSLNYARYFFSGNSVFWNEYNYRYNGYAVRGVAD